MASCRKCNSAIRFKPNNSKFRRLYGMNLKEMGKILNYSEGYLSNLFKKYSLNLLDK